MEIEHYAEEDTAIIMEKPVHEQSGQDVKRLNNFGFATVFGSGTIASAAGFRGAVEYATHCKTIIKICTA